MQMSDAKFLAQKPTYLSITKGRDGVWASAGAHALRVALKDKSSHRVMDLLRPMDAYGMAQVFREVGFSVDSATAAKGRSAVFESVRSDLQKALHGPAKASQQQAAAKAPATVNPSIRRTTQSPLEIIQGVLRSPNVVVSTFGDTPMPHRASLQMVASQALEKGLLGFGFDGIPGKYMVAASMKEVVELYKEAAKSVATLSTKAALQYWSREKKGAAIHEFVPASIQRLLQGSLSFEAAQIVLGALDSGSISTHAEEIADVGISNLLAARGLDVDAPTIQMQAEEMGLRFKRLDMNRGIYFGPVVGQDHRASIIKVNKDEVIELSHQQLPTGKPRVGVQLRIEMKAGALSVSERNTERGPVER